jgi:hypothetical protein
MNKAKKGKHIPPAKTQKPVKNVKSQTGVLTRLDNWLEARDKKIFFGLLFFSTLFSLLMFDSKVSIGGDDSGYIERAWAFLHNREFPYYQGPGYPVFLSLFVRLFGLNVIVLKLSSVLCHFGFVWITYLTFRKRIPYSVLFALISFISFNSFIQYYSSQTYTETFFLFVQSICFYVFFKVIDAVNTSQPGFIDGFRQNYIKWIQFGVAFTLLSISKSIAVVTIGSVVAYFLLNKKYREIVYALVAFLVVRMIYQVIVTSIFGPNQSDQLEQLLRKEIYKPELGHEDFDGMITRFSKNFNLYFSVHLYRILNIRGTDSVKIFPGLANISAILMLVFTFLSYKRNKFVFFSSVYVLVLCVGVFFGVQAGNTQDRLIIIAMPLLFLLLFYGMYELSKYADVIQYALILFSCVMLLITIGKSTDRASHNSSALVKNLGGDIYYGYTDDWVNFLKMSKYCADSLPESAGILSRKPEMSFIYGKGRKFEGQYWVTTTNADSILLDFKQRKINYVILPSLRMDPKRNNGQIINTFHRLLQPVQVKYPDKLKLLKTIGIEEPAYLYEVDY